MEEVVIVSAVRTPTGKIGGAMRDIQPEDLARDVIAESVRRANVGMESIDEVIFGQTKQSAEAANIARVAALKAGVPIETPAYTVMRQCGSGLQAVNNAAQSIMCGFANTVVAGGTESMSNAVYYLRSARYGYKAGNGVLCDSNIESQARSQPIDVYGQLTMGLTAENLAVKYSISREEQDAFALTSQQKAKLAIQNGNFTEEILPVTIPKGKGKSVIFDTDEFPRDTTMEALAALKPVFKTGGTVTAGNATGRNDGASSLVIMSAREAQRKNLKPLAVLRSQAVVGVPPEIMGIGPAQATRKALKLAGLSLADIGLIEMNEAFAAQCLAVIKELDMNTDILNVNGGAIALGHPLGCTGAKILTTLLYEMKRRNVKYGLVTLCIGGGQGIADVVELL